MSRLAGVAALTSCTLACCVADGSGSDLGGEYARQRNYLEKTIESLKRKLAADAEAHRTDELRIMSQNVSLIRELNELRRQIKVWFSSTCQRPALLDVERGNVAKMDWTAAFCESQAEWSEVFVLDLLMLMGSFGYLLC